MLPIRLEIKNFLPYLAPDPVFFEGVHLACLTGPNGAGKSSLLDAITWALWGKARARSDEDLIHLGQQDMYVQLDFEQEGLVYRVVRKRARRQRSTGTLDLLVHGEDGDFRLISESSMRLTQERINALLRLDYDTFVNSAFLQQGKADAFTTKTPKERKQILSDILGLDRWERYEEHARTQMRELENQLTVYDLSIQEINQQLAQEPALEAALKQAEQQQNEARDLLEAAEQRLEEVAHVPHDLDNARTQRSTAERRLRERERDIDSAQAEIERHEATLARYDAVIAEREDIEAGYATLQSAREIDRSLYDKMQQVSDFDQQQQTLESQIQAARAELQGEARSHQTLIAQYEATLDQHADLDMESVQAEITALRQVEVERQDVQERLIALGEERAEKTATNEALRTEMNNLKRRLDQLEKTTGAVCPLCGQKLDEKHRSKMVTELSAEGTQQGDAWRENKARIESIVEEIGEFNTRMTEIDQDLRRLQPLMERAGQLQAQADTVAEADARLQASRIALAAVETLLEEESFAQDLREQLAQLESQRAEVGYDRESHEEAREQLTSYQTYEKRQGELDNALKERPNTEALLDGAQNRRARNEAALQEEVDAIAELESEIAQLETLLEEFKAREDEVKAQRSAEREAHGRLVTARQELNALDSLRERKQDIEARIEQTRYEVGLYKDLVLAFGKNGIPAMIIETAIPELETAANDLLRRMSDGRMTLSFNTQREKKTGGMAETLDIQIADELGARDYEMYSGGEAFRINFAIRVALSQMLARRAGAQLRTLFIDEGFGTQDAAGRDRLVEAITAIQDDFDLILTITHIDELRDHFPVHVVVEKTGSGSRVSVR